jgi:putative heme-binding domain-containing protein
MADFVSARSASGLATFRQPLPAHRPQFISDGSAACLKFDGKDDFLMLDGSLSPAKELTIFILAAPSENRGQFTGFFGFAGFGQNDYTSGLNFDLGPSATSAISVLNLEAAGAGGFKDMLTPGFFNAAERPFGDFHLFTIRTKPGKAATEVFMDGFKGGERDRGDAAIRIDQAALGSRFYSNESKDTPYAQGFFHGAMADFAIYDRALSDEEREAVEKALLAKTVSLNALLQGAEGHPLQSLQNPPLVQMFVPGFTVRELPLEIANANNVRYRHDGKLVALGYDGKIYLLTDTDGDGLEDRSTLFWDNPPLRAPIGMALTEKNDPRGDGVFVSSKGKVSFILDKDRDGKADEEKIIASGWAESWQGVDTLGMAIDPKDGGVYFAFGCANFVDAYQMDPKTGKSQYRLDDFRGTIQKLSADFSKRETICTGVRFTCALAFNEEGDLFATDQEGATWLPNGNPFDELLLIQKGKHYGFPPRHPKHLPNVVDEPAVWEYAPQHQSTVGMVFNLGVNGGPHFGPSFWRGDAIVSGESRGKLFRTRLAKTAMGYVAQNQQIASLAMLTVDSCVSPSGDLVVACHSGPPDWGTGPAGKGKLFKISYTGKELPQPVMAWASAPDEFRVAFDKPLDIADWREAGKQVTIEAGPYVGAGDRFEAIRPGYQVVRDQMASPRRWVDVLGLSLSADLRTLVLRVPRQTEPVSYAITLPLPEKWRTKGGIRQEPQMDLALSLHGVEAAVGEGANELQIVLPHPNFTASARLAEGSADHQKFFAAASASNATISMAALFKDSNPFTPAVQPGSQLDWDMAADPFASRKFKLADPAGHPLTAKARGKDIVEVRAETKSREAASNLWVLSDGDLKHLALPQKLLLPWVEPGALAHSAALAKGERTDVLGNWSRGRTLFFGDAGCATCHTIGGEGMAFGPDLSNLIFRDRESVLADIMRPSATINPDHAGSVVKLKNGIEQPGQIKMLNSERLVLALPAGAVLDAPRSDVLSIEPMRISLMPENILDQFSAGQKEDLLTFLLVKAGGPSNKQTTKKPQ